MKYSEPQVEVLASAFDAIHSDHVKAMHVTIDDWGFLAASPAYEADE